MKNIAMIPARMGSQRLAKKNLRELAGVPLIARAIRKCREAACFDEVWVNSEDLEFEAIAAEEGGVFIAGLRNSPTTTPPANSSWRSFSRSTSVKSSSRFTASRRSLPSTNYGGSPRKWTAANTIAC